MTDWLGWAGLAANVASNFIGGSKQMPRRYYNDQLYSPIRIRVADAKAAGVHPLFALGASPSISPSYTAGRSPASSALQSAGQSLSAMSARKVAAKQNELIDSQIALNNARAQTATIEGQVMARSEGTDGNQLREIDLKPIWSQYRYPVGVQKIPRKDAMIPARIPGLGNVFLPDQNIMETGELAGAIAIIAGNSDLISRFAKQSGTNVQTAAKEVLRRIGVPVDRLEADKKTTLWSRIKRAWNSDWFHFEVRKEK